MFCSEAERFARNKTKRFEGAVARFKFVMQECLNTNMTDLILLNGLRSAFRANRFMQELLRP